MDIIVRQFNVIGLRAEFPKCFTKNVYVYVDSKDQQSLRMLARKKLRGFRARKAWRAVLPDLLRAQQAGGAGLPGGHGRAAPQSADQGLPGLRGVL